MLIEITRILGFELGAWQVDVLLELSELESIPDWEVIVFALPILPGQVFFIDRPYRDVHELALAGRLVEGEWRAKMQMIDPMGVGRSMDSAKLALVRSINASIVAAKKGGEVVVQR
ncbi:hypothetical protein BI347_19120 [Chromobacterium sphagni]|uniref:Uncharacterized protein n=1 Tax=Chromobacterium sphagni TaxID=1903179 RepID=A0A1S1WTM2_9NEIS|nr:hypothetical protein [Chromobacterium sphagni]OHX10642.1 hypothetical protein BI347_19120 [Chromobacterium sphagni]